MTALTKLVDIGGDPIRPQPIAEHRLLDSFGGDVDQLRQLLRLKNGFYAFEGALHVLSDIGTSQEKGLVDWNSAELWRSAYQGLADGAVFFAEDAFGGQFCIREEGFAAFNPETGAFDPLGADIEEFALMILEDFEFRTGHAAAHEWQKMHGPIPLGARLVPIRPFVLGGDYSAANLYAIDAVKAMQYQATIAVQIRDLPDGASINLRIRE